jgi:hypothetical protein
MDSLDRKKMDDRVKKGGKRGGDILYLFSRTRAGEQIQNICSAVRVQENKYKISVQPQACRGTNTKYLFSRKRAGEQIQNIR